MKYIMRQNIKNNHIRALNAKLYNQKYYDFMLFKGESIKQGKTYIDSLSIADFSDLQIIDGKLFSNVIWNGAINEGVELTNIGLVGIDNGLISFRKDRISNEELLNLYFNSKLTIESGDTRLFLSPVTGNTLQYEYPMYFNEDEKCISFKGGFYQGFFKLHGHKYQVLPDSLKNDWVFSFNLRPRTDFELTENIVNKTHPNNHGIFFFIGTRAENKFWEIYNNDNTENIEPQKLNKNEYFADDYIQEDFIIDSEIYEDLVQKKPSEWTYKETESDNKFLMFDRTPTGFTVDNWVEDSKITLIDDKKYPDVNYFLLMNRTETGYTIDTINKYHEQYIYDYNIYTDIRNNVFALRITENGAIGYRYGITDCENDNKYSIVEEYSKNNIIKPNEWNTVVVRCTKTFNDKMKLMFYVNNFLVFISKEIPTFIFNHLNDAKEKQEGVPYNISLGGGTIGLMERIFPEYDVLPKEMLPIEKDFCGTFIGDIKSFKMYEGFIDYYSIVNYLD